MSNQTRHEQLIAAGWHYDASTDTYRAPGSPADGTARLHNLNAAWSAHETNLAHAATGETPAKGTRAADPRRQEPQ